MWALKVTSTGVRVPKITSTGEGVSKLNSTEGGIEIELDRGGVSKLSLTGRVC